MIIDNKAGKTTCTFRLFPPAKLALAKTANELGMSSSQYIEALVMEKNDVFVNSLDAKMREKKIVFSEKQYKLLLRDLQELRKKYHDYTDQELVIAALEHANFNEDKWWQRSMRTFLSKFDKSLLNNKNLEK